MISCLNRRPVLYISTLSLIFSTMFQTLHIIFVKEITANHINYCFSLLSLNYTSIDPRTFQPVASCSTDWATRLLVINLSYNHNSFFILTNRIHEACQSHPHHLTLGGDKHGDNFVFNSNYWNFVVDWLWGLRQCFPTFVRPRRGK
jgi:hypothetical protein